MREIMQSCREGALAALQMPANQAEQQLAQLEDTLEEVKARIDLVQAHIEATAAQECDEKAQVRNSGAASMPA